ncbi:MAG: hypothetical protein WDW38_004839 [Sanguina aurantia]
MILSPQQVSIGTGGQPTTWSLFESRVVRAAVVAPASATAGSKQKRQRVEGSKELDVVELLLYTGGLVWKCEFCPFLPTSSSSSSSSNSSSSVPGEVLAASVHPKGHSTNKLGALLDGPGAVQLWNIGGSPGPVDPTHPSPAATDALHEMSSTARMLFSLTHNGRVAWDLKWCPQAPPPLPTPPPSSSAAPTQPASPSHQHHRPATNGSSSSSSNPLPVLGLLAMVLGDGTVEVTPVPQPHAVLALQQHRPQTASTPQETQPQHPQGEDPQEDGQVPGLMLRIQPTVVLGKEQLGGCSPSTCEWQTGSTGPARLLVGCWDGSVLGVKLPATPLDRLQVLFHIMCDAVAIRRLLCSPIFSECETDHEHTFWATGSSGRLKKWDTREPSASVHEQLLHRCTVLDLAWADDPNGMVAACEDGCLRHVICDFTSASNYKDQQMQFIKGDLQGCAWSVDFSAAAAACVYCGDDGLVGLWPWGHTLERRQRKPHAAMGGWTRWGVELTLRRSHLSAEGATRQPTEPRVSRRNRVCASVVRDDFMAHGDRSEAQHSRALRSLLGRSVPVVCDPGGGTSSRSERRSSARRWSPPGKGTVAVPGSSQAQSQLQVGESLRWRLTIMEGKGLRLLGPEDTVASPHVSAGARTIGSSGVLGDAGGSPEDVAASALEDDMKALHCVRFSPRVTNSCVWVVSGGKAGFLRCQRLRLPLLV